MYLGRSKINFRYGINHDMGEFPEPLTPQELIYQIKECKDGNIKARNTIIMAHMRLGMKIAAVYANRFPKRKDDIIAAMYIGMFEAMEKIGKLQDNGITAWLSNHIHGAIADYLRHDHMVYIPRSAFVKGIELLPYTKTISIKEDPDNYEYTNDSEADNLPAIFDDDELSVTDFLNQLAERDAEVVRLKIKGYKSNEIAVKMGLTAPRICQILKEVAMIWEKKHGPR